MSAANYMDIILTTANYFPTAIGTTFAVGGLMTGRMPWVVTAAGMICLGALLIATHMALGKAKFITDITDSLSGAHILELCSVTPIPGAAGKYISFPSMWVSLTSFVLMVIIMSASVVATANPTTASKEAIPVQQRTGVGTLSLLACIILFLFLLLLRVRTGCETIVGILLGILAGAGFGFVWWVIMRTGGPAVWDVHGVMLGTQPGSLRTGPLACLPVGRK